MKTIFALACLVAIFAFGQAVPYGGYVAPVVRTVPVLKAWRAPGWGYRSYGLGLRSWGGHAYAGGYGGWGYGVARPWGYGVAKSWGWGGKYYG